jgi:hypothetical protein
MALEEVGRIVKVLAVVAKHPNAFQSHHPVSIVKGSLGTESDDLRIAILGTFLDLFLGFEIVAFALTRRTTLDQPSIGAIGTHGRARKNLQFGSAVLITL